MSQLARTVALECQVKELEERLHRLENTCKSSMENERHEHQKQMAEVVQVLMMQEQLHKDRITTLEARLEEAIKLCRDAAALPRHTDPSKAPALLADGPSRPAEVGSSPTAVPALAVPTVPESYRGRINRIFDFYTAGDAIHPEMGMAAFCRFLRDCEVGRPNSGTSPELLWMAVMRAFHSDATPANEAASRNKLEDRSASLFARQRLEVFERERFPEALAVVAAELHKLLMLSIDVPAGSNALGQSAQDTFLVFLTGVVFPRTAEAMRRRSATIGDGHVDAEGALHHYEEVIRAYDANDDVKGVLRQNGGSIKKAFEQASKSSPPKKGTPGVTIEALASTVRHHGLLANLSRADLRAIFESCVAWERVTNNVADPMPASSSEEQPILQSIALPGFCRALCCVAERVYGDAAVASLYPTPASRMKKLMSKMFVLS